MRMHKFLLQNTEALAPSECDRGNDKGRHEADPDRLSGITYPSYSHAILISTYIAQF